MKTSTFFLSSLIAAAAMSVNARATDPTVSESESTQLSFTGSVDKMIPGSCNTSDYTLTFDNVTGGYFGASASSNETFHQNIVINGLISNNGFGEHITTFAGTVTGSGTFEINNKGLGQDFVFSGDVSGYTGEIESAQSFLSTEEGFALTLGNTKTGIIQFGAGAATTAAATANISGKGSITTTGILRYNYASGTEALSVGNTSISARYLEFSGGADYAVNSTLKGKDGTTTNNTLKVSAGTVTLNNTVSNFGNIIVDSGATLNFNSSDEGTIKIVNEFSSTNKNSITLNGGKLANIGTSVGSGSKQLHGLTLTANSTVGGTKDFGLVKESYGAISLDLSGFTLTKEDDNTFYLVNTTISNGTLKIDGGTVKDDKKSLTIGTGGKIEVGANGTLSAKILVSNGILDGNALTFGGGVAYANSNLSSVFSVAEGGDISGVTFGVASDFTGTVTITGAMSARTNLSLQYLGNANSKIILDDVSPSSGVSVYVDGGVTVSANVELKGTGVTLSDGSSSRVTTFTGSFSGDEDAQFKYTKSNPHAFTFTGDVSGFKGDFVRTGGGTDGAGNKLTFGDGSAGVTTGSVSGTGTIQWGSGSNDWNVIYNYSNDVYASNTITAGVIEKKGAGALELRGENTSDGGVTVSAGTLVAANAKALGTGAVSVASGATLKLAVAVGDVGAVSIAENANFALDLTGFNPVSTLADGDKISLAILSSSALSFNGAEASTLSPGEIDAYFNREKSDLGSYAAYWGSREWAYDNGTLSLTMTIPEPSAFGLLAGLGALVLTVSRRKRRA